MGNILFVFVWTFLLIFGMTLMANGWSLMTTSPKRTPRNRRPPYTPHPEMEDIEEGDELLVVKFNELPKTECDLEEYRDLQARIKELQGELEDLAPSEYEPPDDEDDDDDGDIVVRV